MPTHRILLHFIFRAKKKLHIFRKVENYCRKCVKLTSANEMENEKHEINEMFVHENARFQYMKKKKIDTKK